MRTELNLSGNELLVYAVIYGFSQDGKSRFNGNRQYLADWCGCSIRTVQNALNSLVKNELLIKYEREINGIDSAEYIAVCKKHPVQNLHTPRENFSLNNTNNTLNINNKLLSNDNNNYLENVEEISEFESKMYNEPKKKKGKSLYQKCVDYICEYTDIQELQIVLIEYLKFRLSVKDKPLYNLNQWKSMLNKLDKVVEECKKDYIDIVQQSIDKAWLNFYPITENKNKKDVFAEGSGLSCEQSTDDEETRKEILAEQGKRTEF